MKKTTLSLLCLFALVGCNRDPMAVDAAGGSASIVSLDEHGAMVALNEGLGTVSRVNLETGMVQELYLGETPFRVARLDRDTVVVSLKSERNLAVLKDDGKQLTLVKKVPVGAEPSGIVSDGAGRVFVAMSTENEVWELDSNLDVVNTFEAEGQPTWLALAPTGDFVFAAAMFGATVTQIDIETGDTHVIDMPEMAGLEADHTDLPVTLTARITGDISMSPDGDTLAVPVTYVDNLTPAGSDETVPESTGGYAGGAGSVGLARVNPAVVAVDVTEAVAVPGDVYLLAGQVTSNARASEVVRGYVSSVTWHPDGTFVWASMEGSNAVQALLPSARQVISDAHEDAEYSAGEFVSGDRAIFATDSGPRGVAFTQDGDAFVHAFLDRNITLLGDANSVEVSGATLSDDTLPDGIEEGRALFYASTGSIMSADGSGISCATCHFLGRNDGLTWELENGARQVPSLAGEVGGTAPFTWIDGVDSVQDEAMHTSENRMGGAGLTQAEADAIAAFVEFSPMTDTPDPSADAVERGRSIFYSSEVGCAECHNGADYSDQKSYDMFDLEGVNTPRLNGIAATAPYLHDGSAATLMDVLDRVENGEMGDTSSLSEAEKADLVAFLESL